MTEPDTTRKSADAFRTIGETAEEIGLPQHVLRFWETRFPQLKPLKRAGGRRFYRPEDVELLRAVKALLYRDGYTIRGVQKMLREQGPRAVARLVAEAPPSAGSAERAALGPAEMVAPSIGGTAVSSPDTAPASLPVEEALRSALRHLYAAQDVIAAVRRQG